MSTYDADVVVIGGGLGGVVSAIAAARQGVKVTLVESNSFLGGTATASQVCELDGGYKNGKAILPAISREIVQKLVDRGAAKHYGEVPMSSNPEVSCDRIRFNPEHMKLVLDEMVLAHGIQTFFCSQLKNVENSEGAISVTLSNLYNDVAIAGKVLIDASGNSEAVYLLDEGVTIKTKPENMQGVTLIFRLGGVDQQEFMKNLTPDELTRIIFKGLEEGALPFRILATCPLPGTSEISVSATRCQNIDFERIEDISKALLETRQQVAKTIPFIKANMKGCGTAYLTSIASSLGVRERRKIDGLYEVTGDDVIQCRRFADAIALGCYPVDIHKKKGDFAVQFTKIEKDGIYQIPYRSLVTKKYANVISSGKCICADDVAFAALRTMPCIMGIGNASGIAAALAVRDHVDVRNVDVKEMRRMLRETDFPDSAEYFADPQ
jgi:2-polyprenyl-6-methoxyphenol hydroxylase-like FAD-dependent oxidoreductase